MLNLRDFIATVERDTPDALVYIDKPVDPAKFEVTAVLQQLEDAGRYPMAVFHQPLNLKGEVSQFPLVTNVFAQRERCAQALGMPVAEGPGEGRFVIDATGTHNLPAKPARATIPVTSA